MNFHFAMEGHGDEIFDKVTKFQSASRENIPKSDRENEDFGGSMIIRYSSSSPCMMSEDIRFTKVQSGEGGWRVQLIVESV